MPKSDEPRPVELAQFLKIMGIVDTGGQAKMVIQGGEVYLNGEVETRRRKKLALGDVIEIWGESFIVEGETE